MRKWLFGLTTLVAAATCGYAFYAQVSGVPLYLLLASNGLWLVIAGWLTWSAGDGDEQHDHTAETMREQVVTIVHRINSFVDEEVLGLTESLDQIESLAKDAVNTLGKSMHSLNHQVRTQSRLLNELAGISGTGPTEEDGSWGQFVEDSRSVIEYFSKLLDDVFAQRDQIADILRNVGQQTSEARRSLDIASGGRGTTEVRIALGRLKSLIDRQVSSLESTKDWSKEKTDANRAISRIEEARGRLREMRDVVTMNVEAFKKQSHEDVGRAIRSLQFEDIVTQLVTGAAKRLEEMNQLVAALNRRIRHLQLVTDEDELIGILKVVQEIHSDVMEQTERVRAARHRAVAQQTMDEGTIELF